METDLEYLDRFYREIYASESSRFRKRLRRMSPKSFTVAVVSEFCANFYNGGMYSFAWNSSGDWIAESVEAMNRINARPVGGLIAEMSACFPGRGPSKWTMRRRWQIKRQSDEFEKRCDDLTDSFYALEDSGLDISQQLDDYVILNRTEPMRLV